MAFSNSFVLYWSLGKSVVTYPIISKSLEIDALFIHFRYHPTNYMEPRSKLGGFQIFTIVATCFSIVCVLGVSSTQPLTDAASKYPEAHSDYYCEFVRCYYVLAFGIWTWAYSVACTTSGGIAKNAIVRVHADWGEHLQV